MDRETAVDLVKMLGSLFLIAAVVSLPIIAAIVGYMAEAR